MKKLLGGLALGILLFGVVEASVAGTKDLVIKIGVVGALTGDFSAVGNSQLTGAQMRTKEINDAGGNIKIELLP